MSVPYTAPVYQESAFNCPFCGAYAKQDWLSLSLQNGNQYVGAPNHIRISRCGHCGKLAIWVNKAMIYPIGGAAPLPNTDMPEDVKQDYEEARSVLGISPRSAAALLRLALQRLCKHLGEPGENINADIAALVKKGLPIQIQQAFDSLRVAGNNAVHPSQLDIYDDGAIATRLFGLLNIIVDNQITQPKAIAELYASTVPSDTQQHIAKRDASRLTGGGGASTH